MRPDSRAAWILPLLLLAGGTLLFRWTELDLAAAGAAYGADGQFVSSESGFWGLLYRIAPWPAFLLALWSIVHLLFSWRYRWLRRHNRAAWCLLAALVVGPGLIVNATLKDHYGRPRPRQVETFGGEYAFLPVLTPGPHHDARAFASGHASIAFFLLTPWFLLLRRRGLGNAFLLAGLAWGVLIGAGRVLQGGHWPSDVLWAGAIVYFTGYCLSAAFGFREPRSRATAR